MYKNLIDIDSLFKNVSSLNENQKEFFKSLAQSLNDSQNEFFDYVQQRTIDELTSEKFCNTVYTYLCKDQSESNENFYPMLDSDEDNDNIVFIDCPYNEIDTYDKINSDRKFKLERTNVFIEKERFLSATFRIYNINQPFVFSPYSRRAFEVFELDEKTNEYVPVNFKRDNIQLELENVIYGKLLWNVSILPGSRIRPKIVSVDGKEFMRYDNGDGSSFIIPEYAVKSEIYQNQFLFKYSDGKYIDVIKNDDSIEETNFMKITIHKNSIIKDYQFANVSNLHYAEPKRIRTKADIQLAVNKYYPEPKEYLGVFGNTTNDNTIKDYSKEYKYVYEDLSRETARNNNFCYLRFADSKKDNFFEDRVNFFISFMRYNYPNFYWVGVK